MILLFLATKHFAECIYHHHWHVIICLGRTYYISTESVYIKFVKHNIKISQ